MPFGYFLNTFGDAIATKAQRHKGFIYNELFCVTLCLSVLVAIFIVGKEKNFIDKIGDIRQNRKYKFDITRKYPRRI